MPLTAVQLVPRSAEVYRLPPYTEASSRLPSAETATDDQSRLVRPVPSATARRVQLVPESCDTHTWPPLTTAAIRATALVWVAFVDTWAETATERHWRSFSRAVQVVPPLMDT